MGSFFILLVFSFIALVIVNTTWSTVNLYNFSTEGINSLLQGINFGENVVFSIFFKWILIADGIWWVMFVLFLLQQNSKTKPILNYLQHKPIKNPKICVVTHTYNEEIVIESVVKDFINQKNVESVIVVDNHSTDSTVEIARQCGAKVITKEKNKGFAHSWVLGQKEALKTDADIVVVTDADGTFVGDDIRKMLPYLDYCDMVITSRQFQVLTEQGNQNNMMHTWGNNIISFLLQLKYFNFKHKGLVRITDVGCGYRCFKREALEKIVKQYEEKQPNKFTFGLQTPTVGLFTTTKAIESGLRIIEIPIVFKKRIGISKSGAFKKSTAFKFGWNFIWFILRN